MDAKTELMLTETGLADEAHQVDLARLSRTLLEEYDLQGELTRVDTEKDATYRLRTAENTAGGEFLVKVSHPAEPIEVVRCQVDVIAWIEDTDPGIPVQTVRRTVGGRSWLSLSDAAGHFAGILRVYRFLPGALLADERGSASSRGEVGAMLGRIDLALQGFEHPGERPALAWDLSRFLSFEPLIELETDMHRRALASRVFTAFRERVQPHLATARTQVIHGDFSPFNVIVDPAAPAFVTGVIDFGDTMRAPLVFDPAVLLGNHLLSAPEPPWAEARELLDGYVQVHPLSDEEVGLVAVASAARVTLRALLASWRIDQGTDRADYVQLHAAKDWGRIDNVVALGFDAAHSYLLHRQPSTSTNRTPRHHEGA